MKVGVGLPTTVAAAPASLLVPWAQAAEAGPFSCLGVHDRLVYDSLEPLLSLAAAAAVTSRLQLAALVLVAPLRGSAAMLAKQLATLAALAGGRLVVGLGVGPRRDDYSACGLEFSRRGQLLDEQLGRLAALLGDEVELVVGGQSEAALARLIRHARGYCHQGGPPRAFAAAADRARVAWSEAGRPGRPRLWGLGYFALGPGAAEQGRDELRRYYGFTGSFADRIVAELITTPAALAEFCRGYAEAGCDELVLFPTVARLDQLEQLSEAVAALDL